MEGFFSSGWLGQEPFNVCSHFLGVLVGGPAATLLVRRAWSDARRVRAFALYGTTLVVLYAASTVAHHGLWLGASWQPALDRVDHAAIFCLIAGTSTPVSLIVVEGLGGWIVLALAWITATLGVGAKLALGWFAPWQTAAVYVGLGLALGGATWPHLCRKLPPAALRRFLAGGAAYVLGAAIYAAGWPNLSPGFGAHEVMHLCMLTGSFLHLRFMSVDLLSSGQG